MRVVASDSGQKRRLDKRNRKCKIEKLPCWGGLEAERWEHPILENSTACTCQMPNNLVPVFAG